MSNGWLWVVFQAMCYLALAGLLMVGWAWVERKARR